MKKNIHIQFIVISFSLIAVYLTGCTDLFVNPSSGNGPTNKLQIKIYSPVSNDTIGYVGSNINYDIVQEFGINFVELYVNGKIYRWNPPNSDGTKPVIPLIFDSTYINKRVSYFLIYYDKDGFSVRSDTMNNILITEIRTPPYPPYAFTLFRLSNTSINLSWKDSSIGIQPGFEIWRKRGFYGDFVIQIASAPNTFNINDDDALDTTVYYYKIRSLNKNGSSSFSNIINTYGDGATHSIAPPLSLKAVALASNKIILTWNDDVINENYFKIERRYSWSAYNGVGFAKSGSTQFVDSANGLTPSTEYFYRVKAVSSNDSSWSNEVSVQTPWQ